MSVRADHREDDSYDSHGLHNDDDLPVVFRRPSWPLRACLISVLITPLLYRLYLILATIGHIICSTGDCGTSFEVARSNVALDCPEVDLSWTGVFPCELGWRGRTLAVVILSAVFLASYSIITACLLRWNPRKQLRQIKLCSPPVFESGGPTKFKVRVQSANRLLLAPTLNMCLLLLAFHLLLQSGDIESNPGPTNYETMVTYAEKIVDALSRDPKGLAVSLFAKELISRALLEGTNELNETSIDKARRLYSALLNVVQQYPKRFEDFLSVLRDKGTLFSDLLSEIDVHQGTWSSQPTKNMEKTRESKSSEISLQVLCRELKTVTKPIRLGIDLGLPQYILDMIKQNNPQGAAQETHVESGVEEIDTQPSEDEQTRCQRAPGPSVNEGGQANSVASGTISSAVDVDNDTNVNVGGRNTVTAGNNANVVVDNSWFKSWWCNLL